MMLLLCDRTDSTASECSETVIHAFSRRILSFPVLLAGLLVVLSVLTVRSRFNDSDMWWHLKVGQIIWTTHTIPMVDTFSFTTNAHSWIPHEWLAELSIYAAWKFGGYSGMMLWLCLLTSSLLIAAYVLCALYSGNPKVALIGALTVWLFSTVGLSIRPHMIGYLLLLCELLVLHLGRTRSARWFFVLPPIFAIWVNCHGSFIFGLILVGLTLVCSFVEFQAGLLVCTGWSRPRRTTLGVAFLLSTVALLLNPVGVQLILYPFDVMFKQSVGLGAVSEWQPLTFDNPRDLAVLAVGGLILLIPLLRRAQLPLSEFLMIVIGFAAAVRHTRMTFIFGVLVAPVLSRLLSDCWGSYDLARDRRMPNVIGLVLALGITVLAFPGTSNLQAQVERRNPVEALTTLRKSGVTGRMLNDYLYGGFLIWAAPEHQVFVDGRADIYDWTGVLNAYGRWATLREDPALLLDKYKIDICLLARHTPMSYVLPHLAGWRLIHSDETAEVFQRTNAPSVPEK